MTESLALNLTRCPWCGTDPVYVAYHDTEWGVPEYDSRALWEKLILDGFQAGLAWITILRKRDTFRAAFDGFEPAVIARYGPDKVEALMQDTGIVRNRAKIVATIGNAQAYLEMQAAGIDFSRHLWSFVGGAPIVNRLESMADARVTSPEAEAMSKDLKKRGFRFVGPTIVYAFMQACGLVDDHMTGCFRHGQATAGTPGVPGTQS
ncbi:DNA-3-methyladenine glycosylase I [Zavarzinia sp. CC-PAN008]|uniref:DNA-3-methyladenine glycosylase I n=1 Tax=Zavarzinia sp. CC-PAN008 TaxID=3243332 RepID=UPI003F748A46